MRNLRSSKKRAQLFLDFEGKCAICDADLKRGWHADHIIPFILTQKTEYDNMQPLCPSCNLKKGKKMPENTTENNELLFDSMNPASDSKKEAFEEFINLDKSFRIGQKNAFLTVIKKFFEKKALISIVLPTRYGKSDVMRSLAIVFYEMGLAAGSILVAPCTILRDQLIDRTKIEDMMSRHDIETKEGLKFDYLDFFRTPIFANKEHFVAMTTQMLVQNIDIICEIIKLERRKSDKPILVFYDECQSASENNTWGSIVPKIESVGGKLVLFTATPYRENNEIVQGFNIEEVKTTQIKRQRPISHPDKNKYYLNEYIDTEKEYRLVADFEHTFRDAWEEGVICKLSRTTFDCEVKATYENGKDFQKNISQMSITECKKYLGKMVRDRKVIDKGVELLIDRLNLFRKLEPDAQAIIFCGNDICGIDNQHPQEIQKAIWKIDKNLKVVIATSNDKKADDKIKMFCEDQVGSILIVKNMASLGLDNCRLKIALDLSAVRTRASYVQRVMRVATIWDDCEIGYLISPADIEQEELWNSMVADVGGSITVTESELINSCEKDKNSETNMETSFEVTKILDSKFSDSNKSESVNIEQKSQSNGFEWFVSKNPKLQKLYTDREIADIFQDIGQYLANPTVVVDSTPKKQILPIHEERKARKDKINDLTRTLAARSGASKGEAYKEQCQRTMFQAKKYARVTPTKLPLKKIGSLETLDKMIEYLESQFK